MSKYPDNLHEHVPRDPTSESIHSCSLFCERRECIKRQRDELRDRMEAAQSQAAALQAELTEAKAQWAKWAGLYEHELDNCNKAESQAAAMAGLLEEIKGALWAKYYADEIKKIGAALAAWKEQK